MTHGCDYKPVTGWENVFEVNPLGQVRHFDSKQPVHQYIMNNGYPAISASRSGKKYTLLIHRIVAQTFLTNPENKPQVNHINGIKTNLANLEWATDKENKHHAWRTGLMESILSEDDAKEIREKYKNGEGSLPSLGREYGVHHSTIFRIVHNLIWVNSYKREVA